VQNRRIDAHQHFWNLQRNDYPWLTPAQGPIYRTFEPPELEPQIRAAGIERTVLVQAANSYAETDYLLGLANAYEWIGAVIGWVPLLDARGAARILDGKYLLHPKFRGVRHLIHDEPDPDWIVREKALEGLKVLADRRLIFEVVAVYPNHLKHVPLLAERFPALTLVIDHLAKPPIKKKQMGLWASQLSTAAKYPNVYAKVSGLNTAADWSTWSAADLKPYIDFAMEQFGAERLMFGSDWPVCMLAGDYGRVWSETRQALAGRPASEVNAILGGTAERVYGLQTQARVFTN
jgi:L-fucono-1,5-lactonase